MQTLLASFNDPDHAKRYGDSPQHLMPGFTDMHRMTAILLTEHAPANARVLVLGGGGGRSRVAGVGAGAPLLDVCRG
jgi:tRNA (cmo5U34)-methyltransferase